MPRGRAGSALRIEGGLPMLRAWRELHGMTATELAEKAGVGRTTVYRMESLTKHAPDPTTIRRLAKALGISPARLQQWPSDEAREAYERSERAERARALALGRLASAS